MMFMFGRFTENAQQIPTYAQQEALKLNHKHVGTEHLLLGLIREGSGIAAQALKSLGLEIDNVSTEVNNTIANTELTSSSETGFTARAKKAIGYAIEEGYNLGHNYVGTEHILLGLLKEEGDLVAQVLKNLGVEPKNVRQEVINMLKKETAGQRSREGDNSQGSTTPTLDNYCYDLTNLAQEGKLDPVVGRDEELERVIQILGRRTKNNPCLVGEAGVGKTAIVEGLAQRIVEGIVPEYLQEKRIVLLELSSLIAGTKYRGEFEERLQKLVQELRESDDIILFIDELHTIVGAGAAEGAIDASNMLKPALAKGELQVIGATTVNEYRKYIERDSALERRFQPVEVGEPSSEEGLAILKRLRDCYESHHRVVITDEALDAAVKLGGRYIQDRYLPDKAIDLIDEAGSRVRLAAPAALPNKEDMNKRKELEQQIEKVRQEKETAVKNQEFENAAQLRDSEQQLQNQLDELMESNTEQHKTSLPQPTVTEDSIAQIVSSWTGIPVNKLTEEESAKLLYMEDSLHERVIGQDEAVHAVSRAVRRGRAGLKDPKRPIGSFIFLGPTGVGKTELARSLAESLFGDEDAMIRLDMSEYMEKHTVSRLIGSPPGYVGYDEGGQLTEKVRRKPYSVILLDEIEKAHPDVFNVLLQILEDGRLTDGKGKTVDFRNTVLIMTSNVGASYIKKQPVVGFRTADADKNYEDMKDKLMEELRRTFRPEFLNRLEDIIVFKTLTEAELAQIIGLMLEELAKRVKDFDLDLEVSNEARMFLAKEGYSPEYGARPLKRVIQKRLEDNLSEEMLKGTFASGDIVEVDVEIDEDGQEKLSFQKKNLDNKSRKVSNEKQMTSSASENCH